MLKRLLFFIFLFFTVSVAFASHFRYGLVTATRLSETGTTVTYRLNVSEAWRLGAAPSSSFFQISGGNSGSFSVPMTTVTDPSGGWSDNSGSTTITLNKSSTPTRIEYASCCKIIGTANNSSASWDEYIILHTDAPGSSPVSTLPAIINMPVNAAAATYTIPASDPDPGSTLAYGLPNFSSGHLAGESEPPGFSVNPATGQITFNTIGKTVGQMYNALVTVTDNDGNQIMLDFLINMVGASTPPAFDYSVMPANGSVYNVIAGQSLSFPIKATDADAGSTVKLSVSGLPAYITTSNFSPALPATGNPSQTTFSWTPGAAQIGTTNILNFIATDNVGVQSTTSVTVKVVAEPAPVFISPTPGEATLRQIVTGVLHQDQIVAQSSLGSNVSIAFATVPSGASLSPAVPTGGANPGQTIFSWMPTPADFGQHNLSYQAVISAVPTIFATRNYSLIVNTPPAFSSTPAVLSVNAGQPFSYNVTVTDPDIPYGDVINIVGTTIPSWLTLTSTGNGTAVLSGTPAFANGGINHVKLEAEDTYHHGNPAVVEQDFDVNVITCIAPVIACPSNITVSATPGLCGAAVNYAPASVTGTSPVVVYSIASGSLFAVGTTSVTIKANNDCGSDSCSFTVTVTDNEKPSITAPANIAVNNDAGQCSATVDIGTPVTGDNCGVASVVNDHASTAYPVGTTTVTWTATDIHGNTNTATQTVTVTDNEKPSITAPANVAVNNDAGQCSAAVNIGTPITGDNCGVQAVTNDAPAVFPVGTTTVTWTVTDIHGNTNTAIQTVTVTDNEKPSITAPANVGVNNDAGQCGATVNIGTPATGDNCGVASVVNDHASTIYPVGTTTIIWTVTDIHGNTNTATQTVTVTDNEKPSITAPANVGVNNDAGQCGATVNIGTPVTSDNCGVANVVNDHASITYLVGTTTVTWTVTDIHGNSSSTSQTVVVTDNEKPNVVTKAASVTLVNGVATINAAMVDGGSTDNCGIASVSVSPSIFHCADIGGNTVTLTVKDIHGNISTRTALVTVIGEIPGCSIKSIPATNVYTGGNPNNLYLGYGSQSTTLQVTPAAASGNGGPGYTYAYSWSGNGVAMLSSTTSAAPVFTPTAAGYYTFTVVATNNYGCTTTCAISICVTDIRVPGTNGSKVYITHVPPGNPANPQTLSISVNAVPAHLGNHAGDRLGSLGQIPCSPATVTTSTASSSTQQGIIKELGENNASEAFTVRVAPNPSATYFTLKLESKYNIPVNMRVMDASGRIIGAKSGIQANSTIQVGQDYLSGIYFAEFIQGTKRQVIQLIKAKR